MGRIDKSFMLCHVDDPEEFLTKTTPHDMGFRCGFCNCGKENNDLVHDMLSEVADAEFV